jgi:hypothetical protein
VTKCLPIYAQLMDCSLAVSWVGLRHHVPVTKGCSFVCLSVYVHYVCLSVYVHYEMKYRLVWCRVGGLPTATGSCGSYIGATPSSYVQDGVAQGRREKSDITTFVSQMRLIGERYI